VAQASMNTVVALAVVGALGSAAALAATSDVATPSDAATATAPVEVEEIVVTAQRREQTLETTPVAVAALSGDSISKNDIVSEADLPFETPGLTVKASQGANQLNYSLRGQTVDAFSSSQPSVLPYINEVQVATSASTSFYDLESIQVLKGPQGTLFGRNSTGGALLFTTARPTNELSGYIDVAGGNYNDRQAEGAVNIPIISDKVLLRIAGFIQTQDGFQYNLFDDQRLGNIDRSDFRVSLTLKPMEGVSNDLVVSDAHSGGSNLTGVIYNIRPAGDYSAFVPNNLLYTPGYWNTALAAAGGWNAFLAAHPHAYPGGILAFTALQQQRGPFLVDVDAPEFHRNENLIVSNITKVDLGKDLQFKNIIGYTHIYEKDGGEFDGTPFPADSNGTAGRGGWIHQFSEEPQLVGKTWDKQLAYVVGAYFQNERNQAFSSSIIADLLPVAPPVNQINDGITTNDTYAGYGQGTLDLSGMTGVHGLSFTFGGRYSSERVKFEHLADDVYVTSPVPKGATYVNPLTDTFNKLSWEVGIEDQMSDSTLVYLTSRRSFRSGGFNFFAPPLPGFGNQGGSEYQPETATDVELGIKYKGSIADMPVRLNVAAYNMWILNIQRSNYVQVFGELAGLTVNVPEAQVTGAEIDGFIKPSHWLTVGASFNLTDARFTDNKVSVLGNPSVAFGPYPDTPRVSGSVYADVSTPIADHLVVSGRGELYAQSYTYVCSTFNTLNPGTEIPGYDIANFRLGLENTQQGWSVTANVKNAFNKVYYVGGIGFASLLALNTVVPGAPRTYVVEAKYRF